MLPNMFLNELDTVPIKRPTISGRRGELEYPSEPTHYIEGCSVQPSYVIGIGAENFFAEARVENATYRYTAWMPPDADIQEGDVIVWDGKDWAIDGGPLKWPDTVGLAHITCKMIEWEG